MVHRTTTSTATTCRCCNGLKVQNDRFIHFKSGSWNTHLVCYYLLQFQFFENLLYQTFKNRGRSRNGKRDWRKKLNNTVTWSRTIPKEVPTWSNRPKLFMAVKFWEGHSLILHILTPDRAIFPRGLKIGPIPNGKVMYFPNPTRFIFWLKRLSQNLFSKAIQKLKPLKEREHWLITVNLNQNINFVLQLKGVQFYPISQKCW